MGYNTGFYLLNDAISSIRRNPVAFTERLCIAASSLGQAEFLDRHGQFGVGGHANAAGIIDVIHADNTLVCAIGGNLATSLGVIPGFYRHHTPEGEAEAIRRLLEQRERLGKG